MFIKRIIISISLLLLAARLPAQVKLQIELRDDAAHMVKMYLPFGSENMDADVTPVTFVNRKAVVNCVVAQPCLWHMEYDDEQYSLYLEPGKTIYIRPYAAGVQFSGELATENRLINQSPFKLRNAELFKSMLQDSVRVEMMPAYFAEKRRQLTQLFNKKTTEEHMSAAFINLYRTELQYYLINSVASAFFDWQVHNKDKIEHAAWMHLMDSLYSSVPLSDSRALASSQYKTYLTSYYYYRTGSATHNDMGDIAAMEKRMGMVKDSIIARVEALGSPALLKLKIAEDYFTGQTLEYYKVILIRREVDNLHFQAALAAADTFARQYPHSVYLPVLDQSLAPVRNFYAGKKTDTAVHFAVNGDSLLTFLQQFKGKVVYLDAWATWCGPCKIEMPYSKELSKKYSGRNIAFVYVSIDKTSDERKWRELSQYLSLKGYHFRAGSGSADYYSLLGLFGLSNGIAIPRYIIIDKNGNIVNKDAPRPSEPEKVALELDKYLN